MRKNGSYCLYQLDMEDNQFQIFMNKLMSKKKMRTNVSWNILKKTCPKNQNDFYS